MAAACVTSSGVTLRDDSFDIESTEWVRGLASDGRERAAAERRLHAFLLRAARGELSRRGNRDAISGPEGDDLAHQVAADALVAIVGKVHTFRGESRFTTWAHAFVAFEVSATLIRQGRRRSRTARVADDWEQLLAGNGPGPCAVIELGELLAALRVAIHEVLSDRQRVVFVDVVLRGSPVESVATANRTNRNAVYKVLFDARRNLRTALVAGGHLPLDGCR